jgi:hypothetical protein
MKRTQDNRHFKYNVTPTQYPITDNETVSTYDQFINDRDTLVFSWKQYAEHPGKKLIVGYKKDWRSTMTVEVQERNFFRQSFEPGYQDQPGEKIQTMVLWDYIEPGGTWYPTGLVCTINRKWWYRIVHKEEILLDPTTNKVCCYVDILRKNDQWEYEIPYKWWIAVFDREGGREDNNTHFKKTFAGTFSWSTSGTDPNGSCSWTTSTVVTIALWDIIQKMTAFWYMERELLEWDILILRMKDKGADESTGQPQWNDLKIQNFSNYRSIEYLDLSYNDLKNG